MKFTSIMRHVTAAAIAVTSVISGVAAPLTPEQALARLRGSQSGLRMSGSTQYQLTYTENADGEDMLYVFNVGDKGFVIASADDRMPAKLGYSDSGAFDITTAPPQLKWWLEQYAQEAAYYFQNEDKYTFTGSRAATRAAISPLLGEIAWDQDAPYNLDCPVMNGKQCVTGCVATAMAQVIKYHKYPAKGTGTYSYNWAGGKTLSFDYGSATFDYANMLDKYDGNATEEQRKAVANLMYACGVSVNMNYTDDQSGASDIYIPYALKTYFNYDAGARFLKKIYYSTSDWEDLVYDELAAKRPVIYSGQSNEGGHEFVCDGYENGYFHINWGWSGAGNGNFLLSALDPGLQGIGGFAGGYNSDQGMVCGVQPPTGAAEKPWYPIYANSGLKYDGMRGNTGIDLSISVFNNSPEAVKVVMYLKAVSETGSITYADKGTELSFDGAAGLSLSGYGGFSINIPQNLPAGTYKTYLVMKTPEGNWQDVLIPQTGAAYLNMTVASDGTVTFTEGQPEVKAQIRVETFAPETTVEKDKKVKVDILVENVGDVEYSGLFYAKVYARGTEDGVKKTFNIGPLKLAAGGKFNGSTDLTFPLDDGLYDVICYDMYGDKISDVFPLRVGNATVVEVAGITLDKTAASIEAGSTLQLAAIVTPDDAADKSLIWTSSAPEVATVDATGLVTAVAAGNAVITATSKAAPTVSAKCEITVTAKTVEATGITLDKTEASMVEGETLTLTATIDPETTTDKTVIWNSSDETVATVADGVVTAVKAGTATITATTANGKTATCTITVTAKAVEATGLTLDKSEASIVEGDKLTLTATIDPETTTDKTVTWSSSDETVATVADGVVTAVKPGTATITATTSNGKTATCTITVTELRAQIEIKLTEVNAGEITDISKIGMSGIEYINKSDVDYSGSAELRVYKHDTDELCKSIDLDVLFGSLDIKANSKYSPGSVLVFGSLFNEDGLYDVIFYDKYGDKVSDVYTFLVNRSVEATGITLDKTEASMVEGDKLTLTATIDPETTTDKTVTWSSSDEAVATVAEGVVTAVKAGTATITATTSNGKTATCTITVIAKTVEATGITLDKTETSMVEGDKLTLTATIDPETTTDKTVTWSSSDETVATVADGVVTAVKAGTATITATTSNGKTATCTITVTAKTVEATGITLDKTEESMVEGDKLTLAATVAPANTTDQTVIWSSSDETVATVADGVVTAVKAGTATITATTANGKTATCVITVTAKEILATSISLDKESIEGIAGTVVQLTATVLPDDATDKSVTWSSSDESVATVDNSGTVTIRGIGNASITATTADGSNLTATCRIYGVSGIEAIVSEAGGADVYSINGILLKRNADSEYISTLAKGIYIIRTAGKTYKIAK